MSKKTRDARIAARRLSRSRKADRNLRSPARSTEPAVHPGTALFEPLERRQLLSTTSFENLAVGSLGSNGYTDSAGYKFQNLPGSGGTSQGELFVYGGSQGYSSKVLSTHNWGRKIVVSRADGANFDLASFDYAAGRWGEAGDATVTAYFGSGSSTTKTYSFNSRTARSLLVNWTGLKRVEINFQGGTNAAYGSVDNFVFGAGGDGGGGGGGATGTANFENLAVGNLGSATYTDPTGFSFSSLLGTSQGDLLVHGTGQGFSSKVIQSENWGRKIVVKPTAGGTFDLASFDYAAGRWGEAGDATVTGYLSAGGTKTASYSFSSRSLRKLSLGWTGLKSVEINFAGGSNSAYGAVDNFVFSGGTDGGGGDTGGGGGGDTGGGGGDAVKPDARISATSSLSIQAGMAVHVNGLGTAFGVGDMDTARLEWDFGDPNGKRNTMVGWNAAHLYENPGTYTIRLKVWNQDRGYDDATVTVNVASNTRKRIYVSPSGSDSNSGTSTGSPVRTIPRAVNIMRSNNGNAEILLQRGARHDLASTQSIDRQNVVIGAYGSGANPVIWWTRGRYDTKAFFLLGYGTSNVTVRDLTFDTPYGGDTDSTNMPHAVQPAGTNVTIYNNEFRNVGDAVAGNAVPKAVLVLNNRVPTTKMLRRYFTWIEGSDWTIMDNDVPNSTREHIVRVGDGTRINVSYNKFANLDLRSTDQWDYQKGVMNIQKGSYAYVAHNTTTGPSGVGPLGGGDGVYDTGSRFKHAVFEGNRLNGAFHIEHGAEDIEVRNNIIQSNIELAFAVQGYNSTYNRTSRNVRIVNNTGLNYKDYGQFIRAWAGTSGMVVSNNLYYAPSLYAGPMETAIMRVDASNLNGFSSIDNNVWADADWLNWAGGLMWVGTGGDNSGYLDKNEWLALPQVGTDRFSDTPIDSSFKPAVGSVAATSGDREPGVLVDFYGKWRPDQDGRPVGAVTL